MVLLLLPSRYRVLPKQLPRLRLMHNPYQQLLPSKQQPLLHPQDPPPLKLQLQDQRLHLQLTKSPLLSSPLANLASASHYQTAYLSAPEPRCISCNFLAAGPVSRIYSVEGQLLEQDQVLLLVVLVLVQDLCRLLLCLAHVRNPFLILRITVLLGGRKRVTF
jgi:hypothetical protein